MKRVDAKARTASTDFDTVHGDVLNVIPPQRAGNIARAAGLITANNRRCGVDWLTMESVAAKDIHVLGDATLSGPGMPKSGHMANQRAKVAAAAIVELLNGRAPNPAPVVTNTCYSCVSDKKVIDVAGVYTAMKRKTRPSRLWLVRVDCRGPGMNWKATTAGLGPRTSGATCSAKKTPCVIQGAPNAGHFVSELANQDTRRCQISQRWPRRAAATR